MLGLGPTPFLDIYDQDWMAVSSFGAGTVAGPWVNFVLWPRVLTLGHDQGQGRGVYGDPLRSFLIRTYSFLFGGFCLSGWAAACSQRERGIAEGSGQHRRTSSQLHALAVRSQTRMFPFWSPDINSFCRKHTTVILASTHWAGSKSHGSLAKKGRCRDVPLLAWQGGAVPLRATNECNSATVLQCNSAILPQPESAQLAWFGCRATLFTAARLSNSRWHPGALWTPRKRRPARTLNV